MPYNYGLQVEEQHRKLSHHSYNFYKHLSQQPEYKNYIKKVDYFDLSDEQ